MGEKRQLTEVLDDSIQQTLRQLAQNPVAVITEVGEKLIKCKPVINKVVNGESVEMPEFVDVPPVFLKGGASYESYPLAEGDYCILMISERCLDLWFEGQDFKPPAEIRVHDYSDAFALVGINPRATLFEIPDRITQIGDKYKEGDHEHVGDLLHSGNTTQEGDYTQTGNQTHTGDRVQDGDNDSKTYKVNGTAGWGGAFATGDGRTATVVSGIITDVS